MNVLVFDTCTDIMYVTIGTDSDVIDTRVVESSEKGYNSKFLISTIAEILKSNNLEVTDINAMGVNIGPGSFTGLRASVVVARVMAQQLGIPVAGVPSMQIYSMLNNTAKQTFCLMDAKRSMAYVGIYDKDSNPVLAPCIMDYEKAVEMSQSKDYFIIRESSGDFGEYLLKLTLRYINNGAEWYNLKPLYIQSPPITMSKK